MAGEPTAEELKRFYSQRAKTKNRDRFQYDKQGNLVEYNKDGELVKTIVLPVYRSPTQEEFNEMEQERLDNIAKANHTFEDARKALYSAIQEHKSQVEILELNREVRNADMALQDIRFPLRGIQYMESVKIKDVDFDQPNEKRGYPYKIGFATVNPFQLQQQYVRIGEMPLPPMISVAEAKKPMAERPVVLFSDNDMETNPYGFLALGWKATITFNNRLYATARHALFSEMAVQFDDMERSYEIQDTEDADDIHYTVNDVAGGRDVNLTKWKTAITKLVDEVQLTKFKLYPELAQRLIETPPNSILGAVEPNDNQLGIGLSIDNIKARDAAAWTGENILGKSLVKIREFLITQRIQATTVKKKKPKVAQPSAKPQEPVAEPQVAMPQPEVQVAEPQVPVAEPQAASVKPSIRRGPRIAPKIVPQ